jgi:hypothetical protein
VCHGRAARLTNDSRHLPGFISVLAPNRHAAPDSDRGRFGAGRRKLTFNKQLHAPAGTSLFGLETQSCHQPAASTTPSRLALCLGAINRLRLQHTQLAAAFYDFCRLLEVDRRN